MTQRKCVGSTVYVTGSTLEFLNHEVLQELGVRSALDRARILGLLSQSMDSITDDGTGDDSTGNDGSDQSDLNHEPAVQPSQPISVDHPVSESESDVVRRESFSSFRRSASICCRIVLVAEN